MRFRGNLRDAKDFVIEGHNLLREVNEFGRGLSGMAGTTSPFINILSQGGVTGADATPIPNTVISSVPNTSGGMTTKFSDGTILITNAQGQNVTSNFISNPGIISPLQNLSQSVSDAVSSAPSTIASAVGGAAQAAAQVISPITTPIIIIGVLALAGLYLFKSKDE